MLILGLVLLLAAGALTAGMLLGNTGAVSVEVFGYHVKVFSMGELFAIGVATGIIVGLSLALVLSGMRRSSRKRRERRVDLKTKRSREQELQEENARLARELDQQRRSGAPAEAPTVIQGRPQGATSLGGPDRTQPDRTQPIAAGASGPGAGWPPPTGGGSAGAAGVDRPSGPPSEAPASSPEVSQEGRRPLS